jgi:hypothetical protein
MHISAMDVPSDMYGSVSDVARPLVHKLNQATMSQSTYDALDVLLTWALKSLHKQVKPDLELFTGVKGESVAEALTQEPSEPSEPESLEPLDFDDHSEGIDITAIVAEATEQIDAVHAAEVPAEVPAEPESVVIKPLTLDMLPDADDEEPAVVAPVVVAPVVTNPSIKAKAK